MAQPLNALQIPDMDWQGGNALAPQPAPVFPYGGNPIGTSTTRPPQYASDATGHPFDPVIGSGRGLPVTRQTMADMVRSAWKTAGAVSDGGIAAPGMMGAIKAYHGSPHDFGRFDLSKIGTGEGAQAYGHGLYFAEHEGTARGYRDALSVPKTPEEMAATYLSDAKGNVQAAIDRMMDHARGGMGFPAQDMHNIRAGLDLLKRGEIPTGSPGKMYEVNLDVEPHQLLDWDKYMKEQPAKLQAIAAAHPELAEKLAPFGLGSYPGGRIHTELAYKLAPGNFAAGQVAASNALRSAGIPGIKYLDAGSRSAGTGTSNFVMFDDNLIQILRKYGFAGLTTGSAAAALAAGQPDQGVQ